MQEFIGVKPRNIFNVKMLAKWFSWLFVMMIIILSMFTKAVDLAFFLAIILVLMFSLLENQEILCLWFVIFPFSDLLVDDFHSAYFVIKFCMLAVFGIRYFLEIFSKDRKIDFKVIISIAIYLVYMIVPFAGKKIDKKILGIVYNMAILFFAYEFRDELDFKTISLSFVISLIVSSTLNFFLEYIHLWSNLSDILNRDTMPKFCAYFGHSNIFVCFDIFSISIVAYLLFNKKLNWIEFLCLFVPLAIFGYLTISRNFILSMVVIALTFIFFVICKKKKESLKYIIPAVLIFSVVILLIGKFSSLWNIKINDHYESAWKDYNANLTQEEWDLIYAGLLHYDTGRIGLYYVYYQFFKNNPLRILIGRGIGFPYVGQTHPHNFILDLIYTNGLIGILLYLVIIYFMFDLKKIKQYFNIKDLSLLIIILAFLSVQLINTYFSFIWLPLILIAFFDNHKNNNEKTQKCNYNFEMKNNLKLYYKKIIKL